MTLQRPLTLLTGLLATLAVPTPTLAQTGSPVNITTCSVTESNLHNRPYWNPYGFGNVGGAPITDGLNIRYTNNGPAVADRVQFLVNYRGEIERVIDAGSFAPGVQINHTFGNFSGLSYIGGRPNTCRVVAVRYVDGTVWHPAGARRQAMSTN